MIDPVRNSSQSPFVPPLTVRIGHYLPRLIIMGLAVHLLLPQLTSLEHSLQVMKTMALWAVTLAAVAQVLSYVGSGYLLQSIVAIVQQRLSIRWGIMITLAASSIGLVAGGLLGTTAATYRWVRNRNVSAEGAGLAGTLPPFLNNAILILIAVIGLIHLLTKNQLSSLQSFSFALFLLILGLFIGGIIWGIQHRPQLISLVILTYRVFSFWLPSIIGFPLVAYLQHSGNHE